MIMEGIHFKIGSWKELQHDCERVRGMVFVAEQGFSHEEEFDDLDAIATHFVAVDKRSMVLGCARLLDDGKIGRVAVLRPFRKRGVGYAIMEEVLRVAKEKGMPSVYLEAQVRAMPFYEKLGFKPEGEEFDEGGIPHRRMYCYR